MKTLKIIIGLIALLMISSNAVHAAIVNAPLDGGLLSILGAAGVAYFIARRKRVTK